MFLNNIDTNHHMECKRIISLTYVNIWWRNSTRISKPTYYDNALQKYLVFSKRFMPVRLHDVSRCVTQFKISTQVNVIHIKLVLQRQRKR